MRATRRAFGIFVLVVLSVWVGVPSVVLVREAKATPVADGCCGSGARACCCGIAGGCGMCRGETPRTARSSAPEEQLILRLARCPGPAEPQAGPAATKEFFSEPVVLAFLLPEFRAGSLGTRIFHGTETPSPEPPPPRSSLS